MNSNKEKICVHFNDWSGLDLANAMPGYYYDFDSKKVVYSGDIPYDEVKKEDDRFIIGSDVNSLMLHIRSNK